MSRGHLQRQSLLKLRALPQRPVVAVVAPASSAQPQRIKEGAAALEQRGWQLRFMPHARGRYAPFFSATPAERAADLHAAFADPAIDAIICTRGGYGTNYLLPLLDLDLIAAHPKPLLGYSDMTAIQTWLLDRVGLASFHAPMLAADFYLPDGVDEFSLADVLSGSTHVYGEAEGLRTLRPGHAAGRMHGGCLTLLTASLGTPYAAATEGCLLFIEDVGVKPYQFDRMLRQMWLAGKFEGVTGVVFGEMHGCVSPGAQDRLIEGAILHALDGFAGPIAIGLRSGHVSRANVTLPLGMQASLVASDSPGQTQLQLLEPAVLAGTVVRS
jgi:muramoyltetrapeptide carboxypeptidase